MPMTGFEPRTSGIGSDRSTNWATTTARDWKCFNLRVQFVEYKHCELMSKISWINKFESETPSSWLLYGYNNFILNKLSLFVPNPIQFIEKSFKLLIPGLYDSPSHAGATGCRMHKIFMLLFMWVLSWLETTTK